MAGEPLGDAQLYQMVDQLIRTAPDVDQMWQPTAENMEWFGSVRAVLRQYDLGLKIEADNAIGNCQIASISAARNGFTRLGTILYTAKAALQMKLVGPLSIVLPQGSQFSYFDEVRKLIESANADLLFVDPYLDAEFVSNYLPHAKPGVRLRLLTSDKKLATLSPAVTHLKAQDGRDIQIRISKGHDRFLFVDRIACFQSGASFKDGAKNAPTIISQIKDAFPAMLTAYETDWAAAETVA